MLGGLKDEGLSTGLWRCRVVSGPWMWCGLLRCVHSMACWEGAGTGRHGWAVYVIVFRSPASVVAWLEHRVVGVCAHGPQAGRTPLHLACGSGHTSTAERLVALGADLAAVDDVSAVGAVEQCGRGCAVVWRAAVACRCLLASGEGGRRPCGRGPESRLW